MSVAVRTFFPPGAPVLVIDDHSTDGTVIVSAHRDGNRLDIRVLDDGVGLPAGWTLENSGGVGLSGRGSVWQGFIPMEKPVLP